MRIDYEETEKGAYKAKCYLKGVIKSIYKKNYRNTGFTIEEENRIKHYIKIQNNIDIQSLSKNKSQLGFKKSSYLIDFLPIIKNFPKKTKFNILFGDITEIPETPTFVKSRPITKGLENQNSVLLKLNSVRHYFTVKDKLDFNDKKDIAVWRGNCHFPKRLDFVKGFYNKTFCDVGDTHKKSEGLPYHKSFMSIREQLRYKYIISIEGNDVATNLKWIMRSNSLCMMVKPEFETWFLEGLLQPGVHYVELKNDYSDLEEKISFYNANPEKAIEIIQNANKHTEQFFDTEREDVILHEVARRYFKLSGQISD